MDISIEQFGDVYQHAKSVHHWSRQTYHQITAGKPHSLLVQFTGRRLHCFRERINQRVVQQGEGPRGKVCFGVPLAVTGPVQVQGREANEHSLLVLWDGEKFMLHAPKNMDMISLTFDREAFEHVLSEAPNGEELSRLLRQPVVHVPPRLMAQARHRLRTLFEDPASLVDAARSDDAEKNLEAVLMAEILKLVSSPECDKSQRGRNSTCGSILEKAHRLASAQDQAAPSVMDICRQLRVSRRTVQNAFRKGADTTPLNYIRSIRLNAVRRELLGSRPGQLKVGDAAALWGFFHSGHFAAEYQELFGECPSQTPRLGTRKALQMHECIYQPGPDPFTAAGV